MSEGAAEGAKISEEAGGIRFDILVLPRASRERIGPVAGDRIKVSVSAPPLEGRANEAVIRLLARFLGVSRQQVEIVAGEKGRRKTVRVRGVDRASLLGLLGGDA